MRLTISILGAEVFAIDTTASDDAGAGDATASPVAFGFSRFGKWDENEETP